VGSSEAGRDEEIPADLGTSGMIRAVSGRGYGGGGKHVWTDLGRRENPKMIAPYGREMNHFLPLLRPGGTVHTYIYGEIT
jgi:hypothetical protein